MSTELPIHSDSPEFYPAHPLPNGIGMNGGMGGWAPESEAKGGGFKRYLATLLRFKWIVLATVLVGTTAGYIASRFVKKTYVVQAMIMMDDRGSKAGPIQEGRVLDQNAWDELLKSFTVLDSVVLGQRLYLDMDDKYQKLFSTFSLTDSSRYGDFRLEKQGGYLVLTDVGNGGTVVERTAPTQPAGRNMHWQWDLKPEEVPAGIPIDFSVSRVRDKALELGRQVNSKIKKNGSFINLQLQGTSPGRITRTMNALINRFVDAASELKRSKLDEFAYLLKQQLSVAEQNLKAIELELQAFTTETITMPSEAGTVTTGAGGASTPTSTYIALKIQADQLKRDREALQRATLHARDSVYSVAELEAIPAVQGAAELKTVLMELTTKRANVRALLYKYTDANPDVKTARAEIDILNKETIPGMVAALDAELMRREQQLMPSLTAATSELRGIPERVMREAQLKRQRAIAENLYTMLRSRNEEAELAALGSRPDLKIVDQARLPRRALHDSRLQILLLGIFGSLGLAVAGVVLFDRFDPRVRYPEQVTHGLRLPILAAVPQLKQANGNGARSVESTSQAVESFRALRLTLLHAAGQDRRLVLSISSPGSGDGKSFVAMNLALAFAEQGYRTILIDGDTRRGTLHRFVGCSRKPGLTDLLGGTTTREIVIQKTSYPRLDLIPCGTRLQSGPELLGLPEMPQLIRDLRAAYDVVLVDSPPLGAGVDPYILGTTTGNMMIVVRAGYTDREFTEAKLGTLDGLPIKVIGAILNGVPAGGVYRYYSYLTGYEATDEMAAVDENALPVVTG